MRKFSLFAALLLIVSVLAGCADAGPNNDTVPSDLTYTGTFLDLVAEEERNTPPEDGELKITKVDKETGWCVVPAMSSGDAEFLYPRMNYDGERYQLQFENGLLTGYMLLGTGDLSVTADDVYGTDEEMLVELFNEYVHQVDEFLEAEEAKE